MAIFSTSRYYNSVVDYISAENDGAPTAIVFYKPEDLSEAKFITHVYVEGETLHQLSWRYFDRPDFWWAIIEYNPEIVDFFNIAPGTVIRIPSV